MNNGTVFTFNAKKEKGSVLHFSLSKNFTRMQAHWFGRLYCRTKQMWKLGTCNYKICAEIFPLWRNISTMGRAIAALACDFQKTTCMLLFPIVGS